MRRIMLLVTVAFMPALSGPGEPRGTHGSGGGGHFKYQFFDTLFNFGFGGGSDVGEGGGGGCLTNLSTGERFCLGGGGGGKL